MAITAIGKSKVLEAMRDNLSHIAFQEAGVEFFRKAISDETIDGDTLILDVFLEESEVNGVVVSAIDVYGWGATDTLESGTQFSTNSSSFEKTSAETLTVSVEVTITEV